MFHTRILEGRPAILAASALLFAALLVIALPSAPATASEGACPDGDGVTVVVDATDIGGVIVTRCAPGDPATGRDALESAGFVATDSQPGMICAIDAQPDPCPATFEGSYWSYWHATADGDWVSYLVGADSSDPVQGEVEGWRYNDGSAGPGIAPADVAAEVATQSSAPSATASPAAAVTVTATPTAAAVDDSSSNATATGDRLVLLISIGVAALIAVLVVVFLVRSRNRRASEED